MTAPEVPTWFDWAKDIGVPIMTFVAGFFFAFFFLTKKDRLDFEQKNLENTNERIPDFRHGRVDCAHLGQPTLLWTIAPVTGLK